MNFQDNLASFKNKLRKNKIIYYLYQVFFDFYYYHKPSRQLGLKYYGDPLNLKNIWEAEELEIIQKFLPTADAVINIGANIGYYVCFFASKGIKMIAVEPIQRNLKFLYKNLVANKLSEVEVFPIALSNRIGLQKMYGKAGLASLVKGWYGQPENQFHYVPVNTMDNLLHNRFEGKKLLIIIDIEGNEYQLLQKAEHYINLNPKPVWLIEVAMFPQIGEQVKENKDIFATFTLFFQSGYSAWWIFKGLKEVTNENLPNILRNNRLKTGNFLFLNKTEEKILFS